MMSIAPNSTAKSVGDKLFALNKQWRSTLEKLNVLESNSKSSFGDLGASPKICA